MRVVTSLTEVKWRRQLLAFLGLLMFGMSVYFAINGVPDGWTTIQIASVLFLGLSGVLFLVIAVVGSHKAIIEVTDAI